MKVTNFNSMSLKAFAKVMPDQCEWLEFFGRRYNEKYKDLANAVGYKGDPMLLSMWLCLICTKANLMKDLAWIWVPIAIAGECSLVPWLDVWEHESVGKVSNFLVSSCRPEPKDRQVGVCTVHVHHVPKPDL